MALAPNALLTTPTRLIDQPTTLLPPTSTENGGLTTLPTEPVSQTLLWKGGTAGNDPTVAGNWDPAVAPAMAANQTLVMNSGTMELNGGNLQANQLNISTPADKTATINLKDHGTLDVNIPDTAIPNIAVNMSGGGEAVFNVFAGPNSDPDINVKIDASKLDIQANLAFGKLDVTGVNGGTAYFQGDSHLNGTSVILDTKLDGSGAVSLGSSGVHPGRVELTQSPVPVGLTISALEHDPAGGANGVILDAGSASTTVGGEIRLQDAFVKIRGLDISGYSQTGNEYDFFSKGVKVDALDIVAVPGSGPLLVGFNANGVYVYNADPSKMPLGAGNGLGGGGSGGGMMMQQSLVAESLVGGPALSPLSLQT